MLEMAEQKLLARCRRGEKLRIAALCTRLPPRYAQGFGDEYIASRCPFAPLRASAYVLAMTEGGGAPFTGCIRLFVSHSWTVLPIRPDWHRLADSMRGQFPRAQHAALLQREAQGDRARRPCPYPRGAAACWVRETQHAASLPVLPVPLCYNRLDWALSPANKISRWRHYAF